MALEDLTQIGLGSAPARSWLAKIAPYTQGATFKFGDEETWFAPRKVVVGATASGSLATCVGPLFAEMFSVEVNQALPNTIGCETIEVLSGDIEWTPVATYFGRRAPEQDVRNEFRVLWTRHHEGSPADRTGASQSPSSADRAFVGVVASVEAESVADGENHPAETVLAKFVATHGGSYLVAALFAPGFKGSRTASFLRLLGRISGVDAMTRRTLVERGLVATDVEVRDAAMQAAESWEDAALAAVLKNHREPVAWLADYAARVARDLEG